LQITELHKNCPTAIFHGAAQSFGHSQFDHRPSSSASRKEVREQTNNVIQQFLAVAALLEHLISLTMLLDFSPISVNKKSKVWHSLTAI
jgi:hypothetical protein